MLLSVSLASTAKALRSGTLDLMDFIEGACEQIDALEPEIHALLPESGRLQRLRVEAEALLRRYPDVGSRPVLFGVLLGVKDLFQVDGFPTRAGSQLPPEVFIGPEAHCVKALRSAGAIILGKTVSAEFAWVEPGPTGNPHNPRHTPGGSSSGSAAAVAAGYCPLALGTQTIGSIIRPAAFCGVVGFKPTYGRIASEGLIACAPSLDTVGFFMQDVEGISLVASLLCKNWQTITPGAKPVLGVPDGLYLQQASPEGMAAFNVQLAQLEKAGYTVRRVAALSNIASIAERHMEIVFAEMAQVHAEWFSRYEPLYRPRTVTAIRDGQHKSAEELQAARAGQHTLCAELEALMTQHGIDLWVCPAAPGPAPEGILATGNPAMNLPWTYAGMPAITLPAGFAENGLPLGLQVIGAAMADERLVAWAAEIAERVGWNSGGKA